MVVTGGGPVGPAGILLRLLVFALGIGVFVAGWWWVASHQAIDLWVLAWIAAGVAGVVGVTVLWVRWNRRIFRRKGARIDIRDPGPLPVRDQLGRRVEVEPGSRHAPMTRLDVEDAVVVIAADRRA